MSMDSLGLPPGFGFYPNDKELLNFYLKPKVFGKELPCEIIVEKQIYGPNSNPWDVLDDLSTSWMIRDNLKTVYVFTPLTKIAAGSNSRGGGGGGGVKKENYVKKAGCGTWHGETSREPIMEDDRVIGFRRLLVFQINHVDFCLTNQVDFNKIGHWLMHEYVLCGFEDYALCRITVDMSKMARVKKLCASRICSSIKPKANKKTTAKVSTCEASKGTATAKDNIEQVVLNQSFSLASATCVFPNYDHTIVLPLHADVGSFRVEEKECQGFAVSGQALTLEEADQLLMNDTEDFNNLGNFGIDVTSFDFESFLNDESWSELVDKVSNSNNVQTMQNMSCSTALGKRKAFEAQQLCSSKKLCSVHDERFLGTSEGFNSFQCSKLDWRRSPVHVLRAWHCRHSMTAMALQTIVDKVLPLHGDVGSFGVEEKECQGFAVSGQALTPEETVQFLMNDSEDFVNFGIEELSNFGGGYMDVTSFDFESFFSDGSWSDVAELVDSFQQQQCADNAKHELQKSVGNKEGI